MSLSSPEELVGFLRGYLKQANKEQARPEYADYDVQVLPVDYSDHRALCYALQGVHLVISTFSGTEQLSLINAAGHSGVRLFVPAEFEGSLSRRPSRNDPLDRGSSQALSLLRQWTQSSRMKYTVFSCGIFMERFLPYGLGSLSIGFGSGAAGVGDFLVDFNNATAEYVERDARGHSVRVCLTSVYDVARFVVAAIEIGPGNWPREFTMRGDRMSVRDLVGACSQARNSKPKMMPQDGETFVVVFSNRITQSPLATSDDRCRMFSRMQPTGPSKETTKEHFTTRDF